MSGLRQPGLIHTISGRGINLTNFTADDVSILDIAWGLGRTLRYGGHIVEDYTVAHHSIIMSYYVAEEFQLEALMHDSGEAYMGDIIWPVKALFPVLEDFENTLTNVIMETCGVKADEYTAYAISDKVSLAYVKSEAVRTADRDLLEHECFEVGRGGVFHPNVEGAWLEAALAHQEYWYAPQFAFLQRFRELTGVEEPYDLSKDGTLDLLDQVWFKQKPEDVRNHNQELIDRLAEEEEADKLTPAELEELLGELGDE